MPFDAREQKTRLVFILYINLVCFWGLVANFCFSHLPPPPPQLLWKEAGRKVTQRRCYSTPPKLERVSQPGLQQGAPCPARILLKVAGAESNVEFPHGHVCLHTVQMNHGSLPKPPPPSGHLEPPGPGLFRASQRQPAQEKGLYSQKPRLLNSTEISSGASSEEGGASSQV